MIIKQKIGQRIRFYCDNNLISIYRVKNENNAIIDVVCNYCSFECVIETDDLRQYLYFDMFILDDENNKSQYKYTINDGVVTMCDEKNMTCEVIK